MDFEEHNTKKRSLGALRKAPKTKPRSPDLVGTLALQRHTMKEIGKQFEETGSDEIACCLAGWINQDSSGQYLTVELSPRYVRREHRPTQRSNLSWLLDEQEDV
jgi:hypothetical protein